MFYARLNDDLMQLPFDVKAVRLVKNASGSLAVAEQNFDYPSTIEATSDAVTALANQLVRCLGHLADLPALKRCVTDLIGNVS